MDVKRQETQADNTAREAPQPNNEPTYDLSFAYRFHWECPDRQIHDALKVLLCSCEDEHTSECEARAEEKEHIEEMNRVRWLIVTNPNTPPPVLEHIARNASPSLLERIAENPRTRPSTLSRMACHFSPEVRAAVAENLNTPLETLQMLARDESPDVRYRLAENYQLPLEVIKLLIDDENPYVAHRAQRTVSRLEPAEPIPGNFYRQPGTSTRLFGQG